MCGNYLYSLLTGLNNSDNILNTVRQRTRVFDVQNNSSSQPEVAAALSLDHRGNLNRVHLNRPSTPQKRLRMEILCAREGSGTPDLVNCSTMMYVTFLESNRLGLESISVQVSTFDAS